MATSRLGGWREDSLRIARGTLQLARENVLAIALALLVIVFIGLLEHVANGQIMRLDTLAYNLFVIDLRRGWLTPAMEGFSNLASPAVVAVMALVVAAFAPGRMPGRCVTLNLACALALNQMLKNIVQRPRPDGFRLVAEIGYSFPSGHSMISMAFYGLLIWFVWCHEADRLMRWVWSGILALIIVMVGVSRVYLGVHYASDVIAGFCVSLAWLIFFVRVIAPAFMGGEDGTQGDAPSR